MHNPTQLSRSLNACLNKREREMNADEADHSKLLVTEIISLKLRAHIREY